MLSYPNFLSTSALENLIRVATLQGYLKGGGRLVLEATLVIVRWSSSSVVKDRDTFFRTIFLIFL